MEWKQIFLDIFINWMKAQEWKIHSRVDLNWAWIMVNKNFVWIYNNNQFEIEYNLFEHSLKNIYIFELKRIIKEKLKK